MVEIRRAAEPASTSPHKARWLLPVIPLAALGVAVIRGFRPPIPWAFTQAQFTCDLIPKRCAFGQVLSSLHFPAERYDAFTGLATILLGAALALYGVLALRSRLLSTLEGLTITAALAASFGVTLIAAMNGYLDIPMALLAVGCFLAPERLRVPVAWAAAVAGVLVHEAYLVIFLPVSLLPLLLRVRRPVELLAPATIAASALTVAIRLALEKPLAPDQADRALAVIQARADSWIDSADFQVMSRSLADNLHLMTQLSQTGWWRGQILAGAATLAPPAVLFLWLVLWGEGLAPGRARVLAALAALAPLAMNVLGFDAQRWSALCTPTMLLALAALYQAYGPLRLKAKPLFVGVAAMLSLFPLILPRPLAQNPSLPPTVTQIIGQR